MEKEIHFDTPFKTTSKASKIIKHGKPLEKWQKPETGHGVYLIGYNPDKFNEKDAFEADKENQYLYWKKKMKSAFTIYKINKKILPKTKK